MWRVAHPFRIETTLGGLPFAYSSKGWARSSPEFEKRRLTLTVLFLSFRPV